MSDRYSIEIPNEKLRIYKVIALIIAVINFLAFALITFSSPGGITSNSLIIFGLALSLAGLIRAGIRKHQSPLLQFRLEFILIPCAIIWMISSAFFPGLLLMAFSILIAITGRKNVIHFSKDGITYPSFPEKVFLWIEIDFAVLKDDILTIETLDNHLLQFTLDPAVSDLIDPIAFNQFCIQMALPKQV